MFLTEKRRITSRHEYRHLVVCYGTVPAAIIDTTLETIMDALLPKTYSLPSESDTRDLFDATARTHMVCNNANEERFTYLRRFKCKKLLSGVERFDERLVYSRFFDAHISERSGNGIDGLLAALEDKRLEVNLQAEGNSQTSVHLRHQP
jgi:hypothetical protein